MIRRNVCIRSEEGLQPQSAALLVQVAGRFSSSVCLERGSKRVNAKSIMGVMSLKLRKGDALILSVSGSDEESASEAVARLIENGEA